VTAVAFPASPRVGKRATAAPLYASVLNVRNPAPACVFSHAERFGAGPKHSVRKVEVIDLAGSGRARIAVLETHLAHVPERLVARGTSGHVAAFTAHDPACSRRGTIYGISNLTRQAESLQLSNSVNVNQVKDIGTKSVSLIRGPELARLRVPQGALHDLIGHAMSHRFD